MNERVSVVIRVKPTNLESSIKVSENIVSVVEKKVSLDQSEFIRTHEFSCTSAYPPASSTSKIFADKIVPILSGLKQKQTATFIAYGQTGSGKTFTLFGKSEGLLFLATKYVFGRQSSISISFLEIYNNRIYDLLNFRDNVTVFEHEGRVILRNLVEKVVQANEFSQVLDDGLRHRQVGKTTANSISSRSHAIIKIRYDGKTLVFVDLAGCERGSDRNPSDCVINIEGAEINKSLLTLKECIRGVDLGRSHLPFRRSKITHILKDSFCGSGNYTTFIGTISSDLKDIENTLNTLRYAIRIQNPGSINDRNNSADIKNILKVGEERVNKLESLAMARKNISDVNNVYMCSSKYMRCQIDFVEQPIIDTILLAKNRADDEVLCVKKRLDVLIGSIKSQIEGLMDVRKLLKSHARLKVIHEYIRDSKF